MQEVDEAAFQRYLPSVIDHVKQFAPRFSTYFVPYCSRAEEWAYCYRKDTNANTNMYVESFRNVFKSAYTKRKANRRVDNLLHILLKIARDKAFERLINVEKKSNSKKLTEINKRHMIVTEHLPEIKDGAGGLSLLSQQRVGCISSRQRQCRVTAAHK